MTWSTILKAQFLPILDQRFEPNELTLREALTELQKLQPLLTPELKEMIDGVLK